MSTPAGTQRSSVLPVAGFLAVGCLVLYTVPYAVPSRPVFSEAYAFGYNTRAGLVLLLMFAAAFGWYVRGSGMVLPAFPAASTPQGERRSHQLLLVVCGVAAMLCAGAWYVARGGGSVLEATFFLPEFDQYRLGKHLYTDFDFPYGPLMFLPTVWLAKGFHLAYGDAYFLTWACEVVAGLYLLWKTVDLAAGSSVRAQWIFAAHATFFVAAVTVEGLQYTPLRFFASTALAMCVERLYRSGKPLPQVFMAASLGCVLLLFFSPEMGIQFFGATLLYFGLCLRSKRPGLNPALGLFTGVFAAAVLLAFRIGVFRFLLNMGGGLMNSPLLFNYMTLVPILFVVVAGAVVVAAWRGHQTSHPLMYLIALSLMTLPAGMGRCDGGHITINTVGASVAVLAVLAQYKHLFRVACIAYITVAVVGIGNVIHTTPSPLRVAFQAGVVDAGRTPALFHLYERMLMARHGPLGVEANLKAIRTSEALPVGTPLPEGTWLNAPFGATDPLRSARPDLRIDIGRYPALVITSPTFAQDKIANIQRGDRRLLLLPDYWPELCSLQPSLSRGVLLTPFVPPLRHRMEPLAPVCRYIESHYEQSSYAGPLPQTVVLQSRSTVMARQ